MTGQPIRQFFPQLLLMNRSVDPTRARRAFPAPTRVTTFFSTALAFDGWNDGQAVMWQMITRHARGL
jgi:hypothetical protein